MPQLRKLIVIVPGIGGSILRGADTRTAWDVSVPALGGLLLRPGRLRLDREPELEPVDLVRTFAAVGPLTALPGYERMVRHIASQFDNVTVHVYRRGRPVPSDVNLLLFPYDFRRSIAEAASELASAVGRALASVPESARHDQVIVIAHSLGGLVARYWAAAEGGFRVCEAILTLGTPHRGAPKALEWLINGAGAGTLRHPGVTRALRTWPSVHELLPQYPAVWDDIGDEPIEPSALADRLRIGDLGYRTEFAGLTARAGRVHADLAAAWERIPEQHQVQVAPYFGRGHATTNLATLSQSGELVFAKEDPPWRGNVGWAGDGTVPALSAIPVEMGGRPLLWRELIDRHGDMAATGDVIDVIRSLCGEAPPTRGTPPPRRWLGLDLEEVVPAGSLASLGVRGWPDPSLLDDVRTVVRRFVPPHDVVVDQPLELCGASWHTQLPGLEPGRYRVEVGADHHEIGPIVHRTDLAVVDGDDEAAALEALESAGGPHHRLCS